MKKILSASVVIALSMSVFAGSISASPVKAPVYGTAIVTFDGKYVSNQAIIKDGRVFVPFRQLFDAANASVQYDPNTKTISAYQSRGEVKLTVGNIVAYFDKKPYELSQAPFVYKNTTYVPLQSTSYLLGASASYNSRSKTAAVMTTEYRNANPDSSNNTNSNDVYVNNDTIVKETDDGYIVYTGQTKNGLPHGFGKITGKNMLAVSGNFIDGKLNGEVRYHFSNGDYGIAQVKNGVRVSDLLTYDVNGKYQSTLK
ncbi:stalk domain-containing protein [Paenibacillus glacialis]|uniref:Copper amine oxidase-like N-terminal domain-containing protein n=1 Tax=Paenibacillus glacialis TaxID=494026 RepID=A0A162K7J9_9BACL|nr:stalk domain-containing protein [Paenibacillus glacialis]OAB44176.1 hypothetical protein PGLA_05765 [Paenibacillus glacialis]